MSGLPFGPLKEVFQVVEERFRYGKAPTTITAFAIIITVILVCAALSVGIVGRVLAFFGIASWPSLPAAPSFSRFGWSDLAFVVGVGWLLLWIWANVGSTRREQDHKERQVEREESMLKLLEEIRDKLPQSPPPLSGRRP